MTKDKLLALRELASKSTSVVAWHPHPAQVRGPFNRWFNCPEVAPDYQKHVATPNDDCAFAAAAMNNMVPLIDEIERLRGSLEPIIRRLHTAYHLESGCPGCEIRAVMSAKETEDKS